ncbi:hypothetical protein M409DRAFT_56303 [Zasmidium cellare ATCC 36951]|uniref:Uncharacterized protein n=1 Tax=Zasmidium cellare ATCC 36951 TaxID=1080233 RepID=A0A6A6CG90_ZASCE|nr:uncharacterized protein M409DRAFT_56303 [Zasmidium cellare ATCC 36951]KAF2164952.1 hypothetical protein M409DRAFT_56303 [Zasmidium cellare ATCC 36951]
MGLGEATGQATVKSSYPTTALNFDVERSLNIRTALWRLGPRHEDKTDVTRSQHDHRRRWSSGAWPTLHAWPKDTWTRRKGLRHVGGIAVSSILDDARRRPKRGSQRLLCPCRGWPSVSSVHAGWRDLRRYGDRRHFLQLGEEPKAESEAVSVGALAVEDLARRVIAAQT